MRKTSFYRFCMPFFITFSFILSSCIFPNQSNLNNNSNKNINISKPSPFVYKNFYQPKLSDKDDFKVASESPTVISSEESIISDVFNVALQSDYYPPSTIYTPDSYNSQVTRSTRLFDNIKTKLTTTKFSDQYIVNSFDFRLIMNTEDEFEHYKTRPDRNEILYYSVDGYPINKYKHKINPDGTVEDDPNYTSDLKQWSVDLRKIRHKNRTSFIIRAYATNNGQCGQTVQFYDGSIHRRIETVSPYTSYARHLSGISFNVPKPLWYETYRDKEVEDVREIENAMYKANPNEYSSYFNSFYKMTEIPYRIFLDDPPNSANPSISMSESLTFSGIDIVNGELEFRLVPIINDTFTSLNESYDDSIKIASFSQNLPQTLSSQVENLDNNTIQISIDHPFMEAADIYVTGPNGYHNNIGGFLSHSPNDNKSYFIIHKQYLESGDYTFNVKTCNSNLTISDPFSVGCEADIPNPDYSNNAGRVGFYVTSDSPFIPRCPTPSPTPTSELPCNDKVITPSEQANLNNKVQACTMPDKATLNNFVRQNNIVQSLQSKGYSIQATKDERNQAKLNEANALRNQYKDQILASIANLETQANAISQKVNTLTGESYNSGYNKPTSLAGYKEDLESLQDEFTSLVTSGNTFGMAEASYILTQEIQLYKDLINDYFAGSIQPIVDESSESGNEAPPDEEVIETPSRLSTLDTPIKVIRYTTNLINRQKTTFANRLNKLDQQINTIASEVSSNFNDIAHDGRILTALYLYDQGILDLETMSVKTNSFSIQNSKSFNIKQVGPILQELNPLELQNLVNYGVDKAIQILNYDLIPQEYKDESIRFWSDMPQSEWDRLSTEDPQVISELRSSFEFLLNSTGIPSDVKGVAISAGIGQTAKYIGQTAPKAYNYLTKKFTGIKDKLKNKNASSLKNQANKTQQGQNQVKNVCVDGKCVSKIDIPTKGSYLSKSSPNGVNYNYDIKIGKQLNNRGWTQERINKVLDNPKEKIPTFDTRNTGTGQNNDPATAYFISNNQYIVINDLTKNIVQVSNLNDLKWVANIVRR